MNTPEIIIIIAVGIPSIAFLVWLWPQCRRYSRWMGRIEFYRAVTRQRAILHRLKAMGSEIDEKELGMLEDLERTSLKLLRKGGEK